jgi:hypothetical protein
MAEQVSQIADRHSLKTIIKRAFIDNFNHIIINPPEDQLTELYNKNYFCFKYANKSFAVNFAIPRNKEYFTDFYKEFGIPYKYGLYNYDKEKNTDKIIGTLTMVHRHDNRILQILDVKIDKVHQSRGLLDTLISATIPLRILKNTEYYAISMNPNPRVDSICANMIINKLKNRGKMMIYVISFDQIKEILSNLQLFYSSDIGFVNNHEKRIWYDAIGKKELKMLHLHHNANYRQYDFREAQHGYSYCFAIHEGNEFIIQDLKEKYNIEPCASANVFSKGFKTDWSKFVKTSEI